MGVEREEQRASCQRRATPNPFTPKSPTRSPQWRQAALSQGLMALESQMSGALCGTRRDSKNARTPWNGISVSGWLAHTGPGDGIYSCSEMRPKGKQP